MPIARLLALVVLMAVVLIAVNAGAQAPMPNPIPSELSAETGAADGAHSVLTPVVTVPDAPMPQHRVIDKKFIAVMAALGGAETMRFTTRELVLDNEFSAGAPWVTHAPQNQHLVAKYAALYAAEFLVAYELKKPHSWLPGDKFIRKLWWAYPAAMVTIDIKNGVGNIRTQGPGGCTSIECAEQQMQ